MNIGANNIKNDEINEPSKKFNSLNERIKSFNEQSKIVEKEKEKEIKKKNDEKPKINNIILNGLNKVNSIQDGQNTNALKKTPNKIGQSKFGEEFASKLNQKKIEFKNQGLAPGQEHRFVHTNKDNKNYSEELKKNESSKLVILLEENDELKKGYAPQSKLQKTLDSIVVKKNKKKKKKPPTFVG